MFELPHEIWILITSYLPIDQVQGLYYLNRSLFSIALDLRYRKVFITSILPKIERNDIRRCLSQASRPKVICIQLASLKESLLVASSHSSPSCLRCSVTTESKNSIRAACPVQELLITYTKHVLDIGEKLSSVTALYIEQGFGEGMEACREILHEFFVELWDILRNRITKLVINSPMDDFKLMLPSPGPSPSRSAPRLMELKIHFSTFGCPRRTLDVASYVFDLLHTQSLRHISFKADRVSMGLLIEAMVHKSTISSLELDPIHVPPHDSPAFAELLESNQFSLRSLSLHFSKASPNTSSAFFFSQKWSHVQLPYLTSLSLNLRHSELTQAAHAYLLQFASTLTSLVLLNTRHRTCEELWEFTLLLRRFKCLRHLDLNVHGLNPMTLANIAMNLPQLHSLHIRYVFVDCQRRFNGHTETFDNAMKQKSDIFSKWQLYSLECTPKYSWLTSLWIECALLNNMPNVRSFGGLGREEYLRLNPIILKGGVPALMHSYLTGNPDGSPAVDEAVI